jgi:GrpB-like predicted nucleotidyltransferase (UPF0157 family)
MPSETHLENVAFKNNQTFARKKSDIRCAFHKAIAIRTSGSTNIPHRPIVPIQSIDIAAEVQEDLHGLFARTPLYLSGDHEQLLMVLRDKVHRVGTILVVEK